jgi:hypothetical protein
VRRTLVVAALSAILSVPASAQIAWDSPALISPSVPAGVSVFLMDPAGGDLGGLVTYRHAAGPVGLGYRLAIAEEAGPNGDLAVAGGFDVSGFLSRAVEGSEVDLMWWSGGGLGIGSETLVTIPLGLIVGWTGGTDVTLSPYGGGHLNLDIWSGPGDSLDLSGAVDLGIDLGFQSGWLVRFGVSIGDREALAIGLRLPA